MRCTIALMLLASTYGLVISRSPQPATAQEVQRRRRRKARQTAACLLRTGLSVCLVTAATSQVSRLRTGMSHLVASRRLRPRPCIHTCAIAEPTVASATSPLSPPAEDISIESPLDYDSLEADETEASEPLETPSASAGPAPKALGCHRTHSSNRLLADDRRRPRPPLLPLRPRWVRFPLRAPDITGRRHGRRCR